MFTFSKRKTNCDCWQRRLSVHQHSGNSPLNAELCAMRSVLVSRVDWWRTFLTNCEEIHDNFSKLIRGNHIADICVLAMIRGLRQALTRMGCLQALESGPTVEEPCFAKMANNDHVYCDDVAGVHRFLPNCVEKQCRLRFNVYTPCEHETVKAQGLSPIGTRWIFTNKGDTERPFVASGSWRRRRRWT